MNLRIRTEWQDGTGVTDAAEASAWARIEIQVNGVTVSELADERQGSVNEGFYGSALPLAEWMVEAWPRLIHERRIEVPSSPAWAEWSGFHYLRAARQGGAMPDLRIVRQGNEAFRVRLVPDTSALLPGISVRFFRDVDTDLDANAVESEFGRFVDAVIERVRKVDSRRVDRLCKRWLQVRTGDDRWAAIGRLGMDDELLSDKDHANIANAVGEKNGSLLIDLAEASGAEKISDRLANARALLAGMSEGSPRTDRWTKLGQLVFDRRPRPWLTGWAAAESFREALSLTADHTPGKKLPAWLEEHCGWSRESQITDLVSRDDGIETVHILRAGRMPIVATRAQSQKSRHFRLARTLYYFLYSRHGIIESAVADSAMHLTGERSEANAFAAELLAPAELLRSMMPPHGAWDHDLVEDAAKRIEVSPRLVEHQILNRNLGVLAE